MRSVVSQANAAGIEEVVNQRFETARPIIAAGLIPIVEPEVDIHCPEKAKAEELLKRAILEEFNRLPADQLVMLKLTLPEQDDFYSDFVRHPQVLRGSRCWAVIHGRRPTSACDGTTASRRAFRGRLWRG